MRVVDFASLLRQIVMPIQRVKHCSNQSNDTDRESRRKRHSMYAHQYMYMNWKLQDTKIQWRHWECYIGEITSSEWTQCGEPSIESGWTRGHPTRTSTRRQLEENYRKQRNARRTENKGSYVAGAEEAKQSHTQEEIMHRWLVGVDVGVRDEMLVVYKNTEQLNTWTLNSWTLERWTQELSEHYTTSTKRLEAAQWTNAEAGSQDS